MTENLCIPMSIIRNFNLSPRARIIWAELSVLPRNEANHFVVKTKEFSREIGVCASTTRRALKTLMEQKLIEQVGVHERHHKVFQFINIEPERKTPNNKGPSGGSSGPKPQPTPPPTPPQPEPKPEPEIDIVTQSLILPTPAKIEAPAIITTKAELIAHHEACKAARPQRKYMDVSFKLDRPLTEEQDRELQRVLKLMYDMNYSNAKKKYTLLTGLNGHPRLNYNLYHYAVYSNQELATMETLYDFCHYVNALFVECSQTPFVPYDDMVIEYLEA